MTREELKGKMLDKHSLILSIHGMQIHEHPLLGDEHPLLVKTKSGIIYNSGHYDVTDVKADILDGVFD